MVKGGLGKGLSALIPQEDAVIAVGAVEGTGSGGPELIKIGKIRANPEQPRRTFDPVTLEELADSIRRHGIIQPILVEKTSDGDFMIVAGERRFRAATIAGLNEIPVIVRSFTQEKRLEIAIIENIQREDLNPIEEAQGYRSLMELTRLTQEEVAERVGKNRSTVANALRLLKLPADILDALKKGEITPGHARAILSLVNPADQRILFGRIIANSLSVREAEKMAGELSKGLRSGTETSKTVTSARPKLPELAAIEQSFIDALGTKVQVSGNGKKGSITIEYFSQDDLERIFSLIAKQ